MESTENESIFQRIIYTPGLAHIADEIFLLLDVKTLIACTEVCSLWKWYIIWNRLLRRNVLKPKRAFHSCFSSAPERSHNRQLLKRFLGSKFAPDENVDIDTEEEFLAFKTYISRIDPKETEKRIQSAQLPIVKVRIMVTIMNDEKGLSTVKIIL